MSTDKLLVSEKSPRSASTKGDDRLHDLNKKRGIIRGRLTVFTKYINNLDVQQITSIPNKRAELQLRIEGASAFLTSLIRYKVK